jgi:hypothetical protein
MMRLVGLSITGDGPSRFQLHLLFVQVMECLQHVAKKEGLSLPPSLSANIAAYARRNLRKCVRIH